MLACPLSTNMFSTEEATNFKPTNGIGKKDPAETDKAQKHKREGNERKMVARTARRVQSPPPCRERDVIAAENRGVGVIMWGQCERLGRA